MKTIIILLAAALTMGAAEPIKLSEAEQNKLLRLQLALSNARAEMEAAKAQYSQAEAAAKQIQEALGKEFEAIKTAKGCLDCQLDPKDYSLIKPDPQPKK